MSSENWKQRIARLVLVKQRLAEVDTRRIWPWHLPNVAATEAQLRHVEQVIDDALDPQYRSFLAHASGWRGFYHTNDLFGPEDLLGSSLSRYAKEQLSAVDDAALAEFALVRSELMPISASRQDTDLFVMPRPSSTNAGTVVWIAGGVIEQFSDFAAYFDAMIEYNIRAVLRCERELN